MFNFPKKFSPIHPFICELIFFHSFYPLILILLWIFIMFSFCFYFYFDFSFFRWFLFFSLIFVFCLLFFFFSFSYPFLIFLFFICFSFFFFLFLFTPFWFLRFPYLYFCVRSLDAKIALKLLTNVLYIMWFKNRNR